MQRRRSPTYTPPSSSDDFVILTKGMVVGTKDLNLVTFSNAILMATKTHVDVVRRRTSKRRDGSVRSVELWCGSRQIPTT